MEESPFNKQDQSSSEKREHAFSERQDQTPSRTQGKSLSRKKQVIPSPDKNQKSSSSKRQGIENKQKKSMFQGQNNSVCQEQDSSSTHDQDSSWTQGQDYVSWPPEQDDSFAVALDDSSVTTPIPMVDVKELITLIAPSDLMGGYQFHVDADGRSLLVEVPLEGVCAGQEFNAIVLSEGSSHSIPLGRWRDSVWDCCVLGVCNSLCCFTYLLRACVLGQILTRMKLNCLAMPVKGPNPKCTAFRVMFVILILKIILITALWFSPSPRADNPESETPVKENETVNDRNDADTNPLRTLAAFVQLFFFLFVVAVTARTRNYIRLQYKIPEKTCMTGCEDCCCALWCNPCTICQMARHTADHHRYPYAMCSENGLVAGAPDVV